MLLLSTVSYAVSETEPNDTKLTANIAVPGENNTGEAAISQNQDWWEITIPANGDLTITTTPEGVHLWCYLYDNDGTTLLASSYSTGAFNVSRNDLAAGTYYLRFNCYFAGGFTDYDFTAILTEPSVSGDLEPNNQSVLANTLGLNDSTTGNVGYYYNLSRDTSDWFTVTTIEDGPLYIYLEPLYAQHLWAYLYDTDGITLLASSYDNAAFSINRQDLAAGTYLIRVKPYYTSGYTPYKLSNESIPLAITNDEENNDVVGSAVTIPPNSTFEGHIGYYTNGARDIDDWYEITTTEDGILNFNLTPSLVQYTWMYLYDSDGITLLASDYSNTAFSLNRQDLAAGTYYLRVRMYYAAGYNSYSIINTITPPVQANDAEPNNDVLSAVIISPNSTFEGHIGYYTNGARDIDDWYEITTTEDGILNFNLTPSLVQYTWMYLYDSDGITLLANDYANTAFSLNRQDLAAGTYYLRVRMYYATGYNSYSIENTLTPPAQVNDPEPNNTIPTAASLETNVTVDGHIGYYNSGVRDVNDYYALTLSSPGDVTLSVDAINNQYIYCRIYSADGVTLLGGSYALGGYTFTEPDLAAGTYIVKVNMYYATGWSPYTLNNSFCPDAITIVAEGETTFCDGESVTLSTPDHHLSYLWSDGSVTETNTVTLTGDYFLTIDNGGGCVRVSNTITTESTPLPVAIIEADGPTEFCDGGDVTLSVPIVADSYLWSNGETTPTITVSATGDYSVTLTKNDCSAISDPIHIEVNPNPTATVTPDGSTTFCEGGDVTLTATTASEYLWSNGETTSSILVNASGSYSVMITDANGCMDESAVTNVTVNSNPVATITPDGATTFCDGGSVTLSATPASEYLWSNGETTSSILADVSGSYSVTITDANGCEGTSDVTSVTVNSNPIAGISADGPTIICAGESVNLIAEGGTSYLWSTGETTTSINVTTADDYSVTAYNLEGCSDVSDIISVTVNVCGSVTISADGPVEFCEGGSVTLTSSEAEGNVWNTGETTQSIVVTESGDYYAENGLNISNIITVTVNANPVATITPDGATTFCEGGNVTLSANTATEYLWSNGETTSSILVDASGSYSVTITDANGCMGTSSSTDVTVNPNPNPPIIADGPTAFCGGSVGLSVVGTYDDYLWSNGETTSSIIVSTTGVFSVTVSENGCSGTSNEIATSSDTAPTVTISSDGTLICFEANTMLTATTDGANIQWQLNGVDIPGATDLMYSATVNGKYTAVATSGVCSTISNEIKLKYAERIEITPSGTVNLCGPDLVMSVPVTPGATYEWYKNNTLIAGATSNTYTTTTVGKYYAFVLTPGCTRASKLLRVEDDCRTGIEDQTVLSVSPNPASETFMINYEIVSEGYTTITISDIAGRIVIKETNYLSAGSYNAQYETSKMTSGLYIITLTTNEGNKLQQKLVIEK